MTKQELASALHMFNQDCKIETKGKETCSNCFRLAGHLMIAIGNNMIREGVKIFKEVKK